MNQQHGNTTSENVKQAQDKYKALMPKVEAERQPSCLIRVNCELLTQLLGIKDGGIIDAAGMDVTDIAENSVSFRIRGLGQATPQGGQYRYVPADSVM